MDQSKEKTNAQKAEIHGRRLWITFAFIMSIIILLSFALFLEKNYREILSENSIYIENTAKLTSYRLDDLLENGQNSIASLAKLYEDVSNNPEPDIEVLQELAEYSTFDYVEYANSTGKNWLTDGRTGYVSDRDYFKKGMQGESGIEVVYNTLITHETLIVFYAPLYCQDEIIGVLKGEYTDKRILEMLEENYFGEKTVSYLCESDGTVIVQSDSVDKIENISVFGSDSRLNEKEQAEFTQALNNHLSYGYTFEGSDGTTNAYLAQISETGWCVLQVFPSSATAEMYNSITIASGLLILVVMAVFGGYIALILIVSQRRQRFLEQENTLMQRIVDGVNRLFARFIVVNLSENSYYYLEDYTQMKSAIARKGTYSDFVSYFSDRIIETAGETDLKEVLTKEWVQKNIGGNKPIPRFDFLIRRDQGERWEDVAIICLEEKNGVPAKMFLAIQDITETMEIEVHNREVLTEALQVAQDASNAKSDFLSVMSHDIRTPMNAILGMNSIALIHLDDTERVRDCLDKIRISGNHLLGMLNEILDYSKIENGHVNLNSASFSIRACVSNVRNMFRQQIREKGLTLIISRDEIEHDRVIGDEKRLQRILLNILSNAVKFTPSGGSITLRVCEKKSPLSGSSCYEFCCEDTGIGMDESFAQRIFEPFVKAEDSRTQKAEGSGLGLPISRSLARMMDGDITVKSTLGKGSSFTVKVVLKLDKIQKSEAQISENSLEKELMRFDGKKVLLVEDNDMNAEIAIEFLRILGIDPDIAHNGQEAVDILLSSEVCSYHIVFMDIQMPVMNGYEATIAIRKTNRVDLKNLPIIAMTANAFQEDVDKAIASGMNAHISKPVSPSKFEAVLREWL